MKIFLNYRRDDCGGHAPALVGRIYDRLSAHFGADNIFMDVDTIPPGVDFTQHLRDAVADADVFLAVIGPNWVSLMRNREADPSDFVQIEIESALQRNIPLVPLLVGGASLPLQIDVPPEVSPLLLRNAVVVDSGRDFNTHLSRLIQDLDEHFRSQKFKIPESSPSGILNDSGARSGIYENSLGMTFVPVPKTNVSFSIWETRLQDYEVYAASIPRGSKSWKDCQIGKHLQTQDHPVVCVSWNDAVGFCQWLSKRENKPFRLPTDHEWSTAVGIGDLENPSELPETKNGRLDGYPWGNDWPPPSSAGNFKGYSDVPIGFTMPVASFPPNTHGIYDLSGNVWEWCCDWYDEEKCYKVVRGGSWYDNDSLSSARNFFEPSLGNPHVGFRCVLELNSTV